MTFQELVNDVKRGVGILSSPQQAAIAAGGLGGALSVKFNMLEDEYRSFFGNVQKKLGVLWPTPPQQTASPYPSGALGALTSFSWFPIIAVGALLLLILAVRK